MLDRESTFAEPGIVKLLKTKFVPIAIDQAYQRRQQDTEGEFYRKIAGQGPRDLSKTTQGFYLATASGKLLLYNNNRDPKKVLRLMRQAISRFNAMSTAQKNAKEIDSTSVDERFNPQAPEGGLVLRVRSKVLDGYEPPKDRWRKIFQTAVSRDNCWVSKAEHRELVAGHVPASFQTRLARFHLVDSTRGEPSMWPKEDIRELRLERRQDGMVTGFAHLESEDGSRGFQADLLGRIGIHEDKVTSFDLVALGEYWGEGRYTRNAPKGKFPLAVTLRLADGSDIADTIPPQGSRGWVEGYLPRDSLSRPQGEDEGRGEDVDPALDRRSDPRHF